MNGTQRMQQLAGRLALIAGALGILAGSTQALVGARIPQWSGAKAQPGVLGLVTVLLSVIAVLSALALRSNASMSASRRAAAIAGLLFPALLCFTTVGRLWYLPGALLLIATGMAVGAGNPREVRRAVFERGWQVLVSVLGAFYVLLAASATPPLTVIVGIVGGLVVVVAPWLPGPAALSLGLIVVGSVPLAVLTWWSIATPVIALLAMGLGALVMRVHGGIGAAASGNSPARAR